MIILLFEQQIISQLWFKLRRVLWNSHFIVFGEGLFIFQKLRSFLHKSTLLLLPFALWWLQIPNGDLIAHLIEIQRIFADN